MTRTSAATRALLLLAGSLAGCGPTASLHEDASFSASVSSSSSGSFSTRSSSTGGTSGEISTRSSSSSGATVSRASTSSISVSSTSVSSTSSSGTSSSGSITTEETSSTGSSSSSSGTAAAACQSVSAASCSLDVYNRAVAFAAAHPTHGGGLSWDGYCGALMMQFGGFASSAPTAISAYHNSTIVSTDPTTAPIGAFHYWNLGADGHVGVDLLGEGSAVFMASSHVGDSWNPYIGVNSVGAYSVAAGATYLGWSMEYNGHGQELSGGGACGAATVPNGCAIPQTPTATTGVPDAAFVMRLQLYAAANGYTGPINGDSDASTWAGVQTGLRGEGYAGPENGLPASNTYKAFQTLAAANGYTGPVNGVLGPNSYRGFAKYLNASY